MVVSLTGVFVGDVSGFWDESGMDGGERGWEKRRCRRGMGWDGVRIRRAV